MPNLQINFCSRNSFCPILFALIAAFSSQQFCWAAEIDQGNLLVLDMAGLSPRELPAEYGDENPFFASSLGTAIKRGPPSPQSPSQLPFGAATMRNALIRFGRSPRSPRSSATMRNALVRFGKRSMGPIGGQFDEEILGVGMEQPQSIGAKRNSGAPPQPFVRFGRSPQRRTATASAFEDEEGGSQGPKQSSGFAFAFL